jgi:Acetyltransferase (GNAT) domain
MALSQSIPPISTPLGTVRIVGRGEVEQLPAWRESFAAVRKDFRYYQIVEDTLPQGFDHGYFVMENAAGEPMAVQPFFLLQQDLLQGAGPTAGKWIGRVRKVWPKALTMRTLMVGCAAGEGHLAGSDQAAWIADLLHTALRPMARKLKAPMVVLKEFPARYREPLARFSANGYTRVPSLPAARLSLDYPSFDEYMKRVLSHATRKDLRRKFRDAEAGDPIEMQAVTDLSPYVDEVYPLYRQVFERSALRFEELTPEYFRRVSKEMPDRARFFIWRRKRRAIAFSFCMAEGDTLHDEYVGLDYAVALDLHLYFYTLRDVFSWAMQNGFKWYSSTALGYKPKLQLKCELVPLDLYVAHTFGPANWILGRVLPLLEPTRGDPTLRKFANYADLWGK